MDLLSTLWHSSNRFDVILIQWHNYFRLQDLLRQRHSQRSEFRRRQEEELALLDADPFDLEAQRKIEAAIRQIGSIFYPCSFLVLDSPNMEFLFGLDMLRKHQCIIDLKENVLRVGGGEVSVPFLQEKDIPSSFLDEERYAKEASTSDNAVPLGTADERNNAPAGGQSSGGARSDATQGSADFEERVAKLIELGFERNAIVQALKLFNGNEEQAAGFLFGS